jgi:hypothetical protein
LPKNSSEYVFNEDFIDKVFTLIEEKQKTPRVFIDVMMLKSGLQFTAHVGEYHSRRIIDYDTINTAVDPFIIAEYTINMLLHKITEMKEHVSVRKKKDISPQLS